jgi:hypothetical protein
MCLFGLGGSTAFDVEVGDYAAKTTSVGLAVMALGLGTAALVALKLPAGVEVAVSPKITWLTRLIGRRLELAIVAGLVLVGFIVSVLLL